MGKRILLGSKRSKRSVNVDNFINLKLSTCERLLPSDPVINDVDLYNVYCNEKDNSYIYRLIFTINPVCSNVLFNAVTEIMYNEGSDDIIVVPKRESIKTSKVSYEGTVINYDSIIHGIKKPKSLEDLYTTQAIRDTEYSHSNIGPYVYHCGYDIFNNHAIRSLGFNIISKKNDDIIPTSLKNDLNLYSYNNEEVDSDKQIILAKENYFKDTFNTIRDYARDKDGIEVKDYYFHTRNQRPYDNDNSKRIIHTYQYDDIMSFNESIFTNLTEENGWYGFTNTSVIDFNNYEDISLNKCLNNNKPCEHIDMYPDRSLYSFIPKINKYRNNRIEPNWDVCLTYPYSATTSISKIIYTDSANTKERQDYKLIKDNDVNALLVTDFIVKPNTNGVETVFFKSPIRHNLSPGDQITLFYKKNDLEQYNKVPYTISVFDLGNPSGEDREHWFTINMDDCEDIMIVNNTIVNKEDIIFRFAKNINGFDCQYYFRLFKKIPNFKFSKQNIYDNNFKMANDYIDNINNNFEFDFSLNKLSFAQNIYSDNIAQIIFTDDIDIYKLTDNLNRPLTEIYLTIIKRNKGYKNWYYHNIFNTGNIEFSHAFGKITSGLNLDKDSYDTNDYFCNIHYQNNINLDGEYGCYDNTPKVLQIAKSSQTLENVIDERNNNNEYNDDGITINGGFDKNVFIGDLVEFSPSQVIETTLEDIMHRFNTAQREVSNPLYSDIIYDEIGQDDYDVSTSGESDNGVKELIVVQQYLNKLATENDPSYDVNLLPEGYIYKPHYKIKLKEFSDTVEQGYDTLVSYTYLEGNNNSFKIKTAVNYYFEVGSSIYLMNKIDPNKIINGTILSVDNLVNVVFSLDNSIENINNYMIFKPNTEKPSEAYLLNDKSGRYLWREIIKPSKATVGSDLYDMTFTNNAFYIHQNINFYLRRQDPFNECGLFSIDSPTADLFINGNEQDISNFEYIEEDNNTSC